MIWAWLAGTLGAVWTWPAQRRASIGTTWVWPGCSWLSLDMASMAWRQHWNGQRGLEAIFGTILDILFAFLCLAKSCLQWYHLSTSLQWLCRGCCLSVMTLPGCGCLLHWHHLFTRLLPAYNGIIETLGCCLQNHHLFARLLYACSSNPFPRS